MYRNRYYLLLMVLLALSSCANLKPTSNCPKQTIGQCQSMYTVNDMIDQGAFDTKPASTQITQTTTKSRNTAKRYRRWQQQKIPVAQATGTNDPQRQPETVLKIWLAAYEDSFGNYVSEHTLFTTIKPAHWQHPSQYSQQAENNA